MAPMIVFLTFDTNYIICKIVEIKIKSNQRTKICGMFKDIYFLKWNL